MFSIILEMSDGRVVAVKANPAVSTIVLVKILHWKKSGASNDDIFRRLRLQLVPDGYTTHPWQQGS